MIDIDPEMAPLAGTSPPGPNIRTAGPGPMRAVLAFLSPTGGSEIAAETDYAIGGIAVRDYRPDDAPAGTILLFHAVDGRSGRSPNMTVSPGRWPRRPAAGSSLRNIVLPPNIPSPPPSKMR